MRWPGWPTRSPETDLRTDVPSYAGVDSVWDVTQWADGRQGDGSQGHGIPGVASAPAAGHRRPAGTRLGGDVTPHAADRAAHLDRGPRGPERLPLLCGGLRPTGLRQGREGRPDRGRR